MAPTYFESSIKVVAPSILTQGTTFRDRRTAGITLRFLATGDSYKYLNNISRSEINPTEQKLKGKVVPLHAMKSYSGRRGIAPFILNLGSRWRLVVNFTPRPLYLQEITPVPI
jgi:hypothetical protein